MKRVIHLLVSIFFYTSVVCFTATSQNVQPYPAQYGKPFTGVPDRLDVNMYQVNIRSFSKEGDLKGVTARLDSIKALGINVVYLMPIYPVGEVKSVNSPYATKDYNAIGKEFGTLEDLRDLVDAAHNKKMAVILDFVPNHTSWDNPWISNKSWYVTDSAGNIKYPQNWKDVAQLNFKNQDMRLALIHSMKSWVLKANIDGFRCDYADGPPVDFWKQAIDTLRNIQSHKLLLLAEGRRPANYTVGFDYNFGFSFFGNLKRIFKNNRSVKSIDTVNVKEYQDAKDGQSVVRYLTNHDVNSSDGTPLDLFGGEKGSMAAFIVVAYMKGVPMIYNGQEIGTPSRLVFPFTNSHLNWNDGNYAMTQEYKKILAFGNNNAAIRRGDLTSYSSDDVCAFTKTKGAKKVFVLSNLRNRAITYMVPESLKNTKWRNAFKGGKIKIKNTITLEPYSYLVLKNK
jgi:glycosidase